MITCTQKHQPGDDHDPMVMVYLTAEQARTLARLLISLADGVKS